MKHTKKILSLALALVMALSLCTVTALAEGGVTLLVSSTATDDNAARAEGATYQTIQGALEKVNDGDTIKLETDVTTNVSNEIYKTVTLDLNGKKLTGTASNEGKGVIEAKNGSNVTVKNGTIESGTCGILIFAGGGSTVTIDGVTLTSTKSSGNRYSFYGQNATSVTVKGATTWTAESGYVFGETNTTIEAGTYSFDPTSYVDEAKFSVGNTDNVYTVDPIVAKIDEKTYKTLADAIDAVENEGTIVLNSDVAEEITVSRAVSFTIDNNGNTNNAVIVPGEGLMLSGNNGTYSVDPIIAKIGDVPYKTLADAIAAVQDGETIVLNSNVEGTFTVNGKVSFKIDNNGHENNAEIVAGEGYMLREHDGTYYVMDTPKLDIDGIVSEIIDFAGWKKGSDRIKAFSIITLIIKSLKNIFDIIFG